MDAVRNYSNFEEREGEPNVLFSNMCDKLENIFKGSVEKFAKYFCVQDRITLFKNNLKLEFKV